MNNHPKISIVTPNFNGGKYLEKTIQSVLNQGYANLEYIIIDGGSTDNSLEIIKKYEDQLAFWISEPDNGLYDAIQKGFEKSSGEVMAWINSDDMYVQGSFSIVAEVFSSFSQVNWLIGSPSAYDENDRTIRIDKFKRWSKFDYYMKEYEWIQQESVFWRRSLWEKAGGKIDVDLKLAGDLELWTRFFRYDKLFTIDALLSGFRLRSQDQLSLNQLDNYHEEAKKILDEELNTFVSKTDLEIIKQLNNYKRKGARSHHLVRFFYNFFSKKIKKKHYNYPPLFYFDRINQKFKLLNK